jgi:hypothetical protein
MQTLAQQEEMLRSELPFAEQKIQTGYQEGSAQLARNEAENLANLNKQTGAVSIAKGGALATARQLYSELTQRNAAMFGGRSSAGPFAQELLGRETTKRFGEIETQGSAALRDIESEKARLASWISDQKSSFLNKKNDAMSDLQKTFVQGLAQVASSRGALESAKATMRADLLTRARSEAQQIEAATVAFERNLQTFRVQQQAEMDRMAYAKQLQAYTPTAFSPSVINTSQGSTTAQYAPSGYKWTIDPMTGEKKLIAT